MMTRETERRTEIEVKDMLVAVYVSQIYLQRHPMTENGRKSD